MAKDIYVDGHIDINTVSMLSDAGANAFIGGTSGLFNKGSDFKKNIIDLKSSIKKIK